MDKLPEGRMKDALLEQDPVFAEECAAEYLAADEDTRLDIAAFFDSDGPRKVHEARLSLLEGIPSSADLERELGESGA